MAKIICDIQKRKYPIYITDQDLDHKTQEKIKQSYSSIFLLCPENLKQLVATSFLNSLSDLFPSGIQDRRILWLKDGEQYKSIHEIAPIYQKLIDLGVRRSSCIFILGGGVAGDLGGFVASTILRGIPFYFFPTTLLAAVDSCLGGKVAVNADSGKNMIGVFSQPHLVHCNVRYFRSLPEIEWECGLAEIIKHSILSPSQNLLKNLEQYPLDILRNNDRLLITTIIDSLKIKNNIVTEDPFETRGIRATLNLGHTTAHAIESINQYQARHGTAVLLGLITMLYLSVELGGLSENKMRRVIELMKYSNLHLYRFPDIHGSQIYQHMLQDKKNNVANKPCFILLKDLGRPISNIEISEEQFSRAWKKQKEISLAFPEAKLS